MDKNIMGNPGAISILARDRRSKHDPLPEPTKAEKEQRAAAEIDAHALMLRQTRGDTEADEFLRQAGKMPPAAQAPAATAPEELTAEEMELIKEHRRKNHPHLPTPPIPANPTAGPPPEKPTKSTKTPGPVESPDLTRLQAAGAGVQFPTDDEPVVILPPEEEPLKLEQVEEAAPPPPPAPKTKGAPGAGDDGVLPGPKK